MEIILVSCSKQKQNYMCTAEDMYSKSQLFRKIKMYVGDKEWRIISAKYGLLHPKQVIHPYDLNIKQVSNKNLWAAKVVEDILKLKPTNIIMYMGNDYRKLIIPLLDVPYTVPMKSLGIGEQLKFLKQEIKKNDYLYF